MKYDGIGFNLPLGWSGNLPSYLSEELPIRAFVLGCPDKIRFSGKLIEKMASLEMLLLTKFDGIVRFEGSTLRVLRITFGPGISFGEVPSLATLAIRDSTPSLLREIGEKAKNVTSLELTAGSCTTLDGVEGLFGLKRLELSYMKKLNSISLLSRCPALEELIIESVRNLTDLQSTLAKLSSLRVLRLLGCGSLENFDFLADLNLETFACSRTKVASKKHPALARIKSVYVQ